MLFIKIACVVSLYTASVGTIEISSDDASSVVQFPSEVYSSVILNDPNISSSILIHIII